MARRVRARRHAAGRRARGTTNPRWPRGESTTQGVSQPRRRDVSRTSRSAPGSDATAWASSVCAGDYDNDGAHRSVHVTAYGTNAPVPQSGRRPVRRSQRRAPACRTTGTRWGSGCTFLDYDRDGELDLFVANYLAFDLATATEPGQGVNCLWKGIPVNCGPKGLPTDTNLLYRNHGDGRFGDVSEASGIARVRNRYPMSVVAADLDEDGWVDMYVASDSTAAIQYRNNRDGTFTDARCRAARRSARTACRRPAWAPASATSTETAASISVKTHFADDIPALFRASAAASSRRWRCRRGSAVQNRYVEWGAGIVDLDNDGWPDLLVRHRQRLPRGRARGCPTTPTRAPASSSGTAAAGRSRTSSATSGPGATQPRSSRGAAFGDFDNDGDLDVLVMNMNEPPSLLRNDWAVANGWLPCGSRARASNRSGLGATVRVTAGGRTQARAVLSQSSYYSPRRPACAVRARARRRRPSESRCGGRAAGRRL